MYLKYKIHLKYLLTFTVNLDELIKDYENL